ncbi:hypothetical protein L3X38_026186 [Prunus dulcis]|uniref:Uncharacterized protein n=1 Tax=Prunus dulcis TaxID=3755 RepID=A0AAD4Z745_PRUDU|nr:hypothetical protein L3X38_026186 [Prunus dulcis]
MGEMSSLSKDLTEEMIEEYEGEDASQKAIDGDAVLEKTDGALPDLLAAEDVVRGRSTRQITNDKTLGIGVVSVKGSLVLKLTLRTK